MVVGSGPGGSIAAAVLAEAGARVAIVEEGGHFTRDDFNMQEAWAYPNLYQEHGNRATDDLVIIDPAGALGRRRHDRQLDLVVPHARPRRSRCGRERHGVERLDAATLAPHFAAVEARLYDRPRQPGRRQPQQPQALGRRQQAGLASPS